MPEPPTRVAVVIHRMGEAALQGLRTTLALSLGDRRPDLYLLGGGAALLEAPPDSELGRALSALREEVHQAPIVEGIDGSKDQLLVAVRGAHFQQSF